MKTRKNGRLNANFILFAAIIATLASVLFAACGFGRKAKTVKVTYAVFPEDAGTLTGEAEQIIGKDGMTSEVSVTAETGYVFKGWSDGQTDVKRSGDAPDGDTVYTALFEETVDTCPIVRITTEGNKFPGSNETYVGMTLSVENITKKYVLSDVSGGVRLRGNSSLKYIKKSFSIKFDEKQDFCGLGKNKKWALISNHADKSLMRNYAGYTLERKLDGIDWSPSCRHVELYFNGEYIGSYLAVERVTTSGNRLNIKNYDDTGDVTSDFVIELDHNAFRFTEENVGWFRYRDIPYAVSCEDNLDRNRCAYIKGVIKEAYDAVLKGDKEEICRLIDIDSVIDTLLLSETTRNTDSGWSSFYMYRKNGKLFFGPEWDFDIAFGNDYRIGGISFDKTFTSEDRGIDQQNEWYLKLMTYGWFSDMVKTRWKEIRESGILDEWQSEMNAYYEVNAESLNHNFEEWTKIGARVGVEPIELLKLKTNRLQYEFLTEWITNRIGWMDEYYK